MLHDESLKKIHKWMTNRRATRVRSHKIGVFG